MFNKEDFLQRVEYKLVRRSRYADILGNIPNKDFLDLTVIYSFVIANDQNRETIGIVNNSLLSNNNISLDELEEYARRNTAENGFVTMTMPEALNELLLDGKLDDTDDPVGMNIMTNKKKRHGANVMLFVEPFDKLAEKLNSDLYILPSSVHEIIAVPVTFKTNNSKVIKDLRDIVISVNKTVLQPEEILSNNVYFYDRKLKEIKIA